jgi:hypothetical protein
MTELDYPSLIAQLGISGIFLFIAFQLYKDNKMTIKEKDCKIEDLNNKLLEAFKSNTETNTKLNDSIDENTTLTHKMYEAIISRNGKIK